MVFFICDMLWLFFYTKINHCWTTFETLAEIEREKERGRLREREKETDCKERQLCMGDCENCFKLVFSVFIDEKEFFAMFFSHTEALNDAHA